jgi:hypothetical protein
MSMFRKYGESLLDQPIGIEESRVRQAREGKNRGTFQDSARYRRIARREYRSAMRKGNFKGARDALDWLSEQGETLGSGIENSGMRRGMAERPPGAPLTGQAVGQTGQPGQPAQSAGQNPLAPSSTILLNGTPGASPIGPNAPAAQPFKVRFKTPQEEAQLQGRLGLFGQMKDAYSRGQSLNNYWEDAKKLGVTPAGFGGAMDRLMQTQKTPEFNQGAITANQYNPTITKDGLLADNSFNPDSPDIKDRIQAGGRPLPGSFSTITA